MISEQLKLVTAFHSAFEIPFQLKPTAALPPAEYTLRHRLMQEENQEYLEACQAGDLVAIADALGDMLYVLSGTIIAHGLQDQMERIFKEIHRSNMSKLDENGKVLRRADQKVIKGKYYSAPDLTFVEEEL